MMTAGLLVVIINVYSTIGFFYQQPWFINGDINKYEDFTDENYCITLVQCFFSFINGGLRNGGGIGDIINAVGYSTVGE